MDALIVSTARTPLTRSFRGSFNLTHPVTMGAHVASHAIQRAGVDPAYVEDVILGGAFTEGPSGMNVARVVALRAGLPVSTCGLTINRFCSTGLQAIALAAQRVLAGEGDIYVAGGIESITLCQGQANTFLTILEPLRCLCRLVACHRQHRYLLSRAVDIFDRWAKIRQITAQAALRFAARLGFGKAEREFAHLVTRLFG